MKPSCIRPVSRKRETENAERRVFVAEFLAKHPVCQIQHLDCRGQTVDVHEALARSAGGAIVPGPKADRQGQVFWGCCRMCHDDLTNATGEFRERALANGWIRSRYDR